jgi:hypothetical protein
MFGNRKEDQVNKQAVVLPPTGRIVAVSISVKDLVALY